MKRKIILLITLLLLSYGYSNAQYGPVVSFTYDDGSDTWPALFNVFQEYGFPAVVYINALNWWVNGAGYNAVNTLLEMKAAGWEVSNHTYNHDLGVTETNVSQMKSWLDSHEFPNSGFASPNNDWSHSRVNIVKKYSSYYSRATELPGMSQPFDLYHIERINLTNRDNITTIRTMLDSAVANNKWIIFIAHEFGGTYRTPDDTWYQSDSLLRLVLNAVVERGIPVKSVREVINDFFPPDCVIECSKDSMQFPVLPYFEQPESQAEPPVFNTSVWNEYWHNTTWTDPHLIGSPVVYYNTSNDSLQVMKFHRYVLNGQYDVTATILLKNPGGTYRLYYSFDSTNTAQYNVVVNKNSDVSLGPVTVTNGQFALYTQNADVVSGGAGDVGWAFIKLFAKPLLVNIKVFLEGPYNGSGTMTTTLNTQGLIPKYQPFKKAPWNYLGTEARATFPANVVDWVLIELRSDSTTIVSKRAGLLLSDGSVVDVDGSGPVKFKGISNGNYYVVVRHRNHLAIMTSSAIALSSSSPLYDFTIAQSQAYGTDPLVALPGGGFGMIAGDGNNSTIITASDVTPIITNLNNFAYLDADVNMSAIVTAADVTKIISNLNKSTNVP
ncbi:MAG: hypothetical protein D8M26_05245 [Ignavibacteriae bacterium]|nr:hypothetical protein [Ignavibacteriota bacterium]GJQ43033.1 MAG: hypothetical protein JETCAE03_25310 [Ignavibacteriaceae bacterium]